MERWIYESWAVSATNKGTITDGVKQHRIFKKKKSFQRLPEDRHQFIKRARQGIHRRAIDGEDPVDELQEETTESEDLCAFDTLARVSLLWIELGPAEEDEGGLGPGSSRAARFCPQNRHETVRIHPSTQRNAGRWRELDARHCRLCDLKTRR